MAEEGGFEWDDEKARSNFRDHGVEFSEAKTIFRDPLALTVPDEDHSFDEERWFTIGTSSREQLIVVWHTDSGDNIRLIGARRPTPQERSNYESGER